MDARELRIGNYLMQGEVVSINLDRVFTQHEGIMYTALTPEEFIPIPLSEDWLFKFGFEKAERNYYTKQFNSDQRIMIKMHEERSHVMLRSDDLSLGIYGLDYVHKLQNLYFALTGEELTIKND
jgi:hypothetical protein